MALFLGCSLLFLFMALRSYKVGVDSITYYHVFEQVVDIPLSELHTATIYAGDGDYPTSLEYGYLLYNKLISYFLSAPQTILVVNSLLTILLLYILIRKHSPNETLSLWLYVTLGIYQTQMNMARNAIAILICYNALIFIKRKKLFPYIICILIATMIHTSSILFLPLYFIVLLSENININLSNIFKIFGIAVIVSINYALMQPILYQLLPGRFKAYALSETIKPEALLVGVFYFLLVMYVYISLKKEGRSHAFANFKYGNWCFILNISFFIIGVKLGIATRLAALFGPYLLIYIPQLISTIKSDEKRKLVTVCIIALTGLQYIARLCVNNIGQTMPYTFFWNL